MLVGMHMDFVES